MDACKVCANRVPAVGLLCQWCYRRLNDHIRQAPPLVDMLKTMRYGGVSAQKLGDRVTGSSTPRLPLDTHAMAVSDAIPTVLDGWAVELYRLTGIGAPETIKQRADHGAGNQRAISETSTIDRVRVAAGWLSLHLESFAYLPVIAAVHDEIVPAIRRAVRLVGAAPNTGNEQRPCPICFKQSVRVVWVGPGDIPTGAVRCNACGWTTHLGEEN